jgi:hypothetical protein
MLPVPALIEKVLTAELVEEPTVKEGCRGERREACNGGKIRLGIVRRKFLTLRHPNSKIRSQQTPVHPEHFLLRIGHRQRRQLPRPQ